MDLFPIGTLVAATNLGTVDSISYKMFEPNAGVRSYNKHSILVTTFQNQMMLTRKKAEKHLVLTHSFKNIFDREYRQIERFLNGKDESLTSFYCVDWDKPIQPTNVASVSNMWQVALDYTKDYSATSNMKSNYLFSTTLH